MCLYGHSAGGLIATLFADRLRRDSALATHRVTGLILNSPFFDLHGPAVLRSAPVSGTLRALARFRKLAVIRRPTEGGYGTSLHRDHGGEFDYNLDWKPLGGFPVTVGWINAIRRGQLQLHRGLDVGVPNLILRSDHTVAETTTRSGWSAATPCWTSARSPAGRMCRQPQHRRPRYRRQTRRVPVAPGAACRRVRRAESLAGLVSPQAVSRTTQHEQA